MLSELKLDDRYLEIEADPYKIIPLSNPQYKAAKFTRKRKFKKRFRESLVVKPRDPVPIHESETSLCVALWRSVIMQAVYDISGRDGNIARRITRAEALAWFSGTSQEGQSSDFEYVCELANLLPCGVLALVKEVRENGEEIFEGLNFRTLRKDYSSRKGRKIYKKQSSNHKIDRV